MQFNCYVDMDLLVYRFAYSAEKINPLSGQRELTEAFGVTWQRAKDFIGGLHTKFPQMNFIYVMSGDGNFRENIATIKKYKGDRGRRPLLYRTIKEFFKLEYPVLVANGIEADDYISAHYREHGQFGDVIMSIDKDFKMIPGVHYNWNTDTMVYQTQTDAWKWFYRQVIEGDRADNIPSLYHLVSIGKYGLPAAKKFSRKGYKKRMNTYIDSATSEFRVYRYIASMATKWGAKIEHLDEVCNLLYLQCSFQPGKTWERPHAKAV